MATIGTKLTFLLTLLVAALVMGAAQPAVTIYNPAGLVVDIQNDDQNVKVTTETKMVTVDITQAQEDLRFSIADGNVVDVNVNDGDVIVLFPDPNDPRNWRALKIQVWMLPCGATPLDVVESVLSLLLVPHLSRCRRVCKTWDGIICNPEFGALCARSGGKRHAVWCFLDMETRRWYTVKDDLFPKFPKHIRRDADLAIMDGGLVCTYMKSNRFPYQRFPYQRRRAPLTDTDNDHRFTIMVYNPITKVLKVLPTVRAHQSAAEYAKLCLVVDSMSQQFKVFLINQSISGGDVLAPERLGIQTDPSMRIYDSATNEWHGTSTDPFCVASRGVGWILSTVMCQSLIYVLFDSYRGYLGAVDPLIVGEELWRHDPVEDAWERVNVHILD